MKYLALILFPVLMLAGCSTVVDYDAKIAAGPAKPADYPIYVYTEKMTLPRACEVIGTMHVGETLFTVAGGSPEDVFKKLRENARQKGADALQIKSFDAPEFGRANYRADANFLRFTDTWESVALSEDGLRAYLKTNQQTLDSIEGIWAGNDPVQSRVGIMKNSSKPGRSFIAFLLNTKIPSWHDGDKKMDIASGDRRGVYRIEYYLHDYQRQSAVLILSGPLADKFVVRMPDDGGVIVFSRE